MKYYSTRNKAVKISAAEAIVSGLAPDGGLYVPCEIPKLKSDDIEKLIKLNYQERAAYVMGMYLEEFSETELMSFAEKAYGKNYDTDAIAPVHFMEDGTAILELFHGPTSAFKDMALQMLPHLLTASLKKCGETRKVCILVATSGDTGKAALDGFADVDGTCIIVFYPRDGVSDVQRLQMVTQKGENVLVSAVEGNFDDAQTGVKIIFNDKDFAKELDKSNILLSSANSINWGRLLPQVVYYISAYCDMVSGGKIKNGDEINFCVPTGNFGNILAGYYAKKMGLPVKKFICASNSNNVLTDFLKTGVYDRNRPFYCTVSPSMDILVSSNLERLLFSVTDSDEKVSSYMTSLNRDGRYEVKAEILADIKSVFEAGYCDDDATKAEISNVFTNGYLMDTHTAVAYKVLREYRAQSGDTTACVVVSTASPYKFCDSVLSALGENSDASGVELIERLAHKSKTTPPAPLSDLGGREVRFTGCIAKEDMKGAVKNFLG